MKNKRIISIVLCAVLTLSLFSACGKSNKTDEKYDYKSVDLGTDAVTITIVTKQGSSNGLSALKDAFEAEYPNVTVDVVTNYQQSGLEDGLKTGDVDMYMGTYEYEMWYDDFNALWKKHAVDFNADDVVDLSAFNADLLASVTDDEKLLALPLTTGTVGLITNMDLLKECGIEKAPETTDELLAACEAVKAHGYQPFRCLASTLTYVVEGMTQYEVTKDGKNVEYDKAALEADESVGDYFATAAEFLADCALNGYIDTESEVYVPEAETNGGNEQAITSYMQECYAFLAGDVAFYPNYSAVLSSLQKRETRLESYTAAPFTYNFIPVASKYGASPIRTAEYDLFVNAQSDSLDWCKQFIRFAYWRDDSTTVGNAAIFADAQYCMSPYDTDKVFTETIEKYYPQFHKLFKDGNSCIANDVALLDYNGKGMYAGCVKYGLDILSRPDDSVDILSAASKSAEDVKQKFVEACKSWYIDGHTYNA